MDFHDIATLIISILTLCGFGVIMKNFWDDRHTKKLADTEEHKRIIKQQRQEEIREVIAEQIRPLSNNVSSVLEQLKDNNEGTVTMIRGQMKLSLDLCKKQGYASASDKAAWNELYNAYQKLGGNHFKEYVNAWKAEMDKLPEQPNKVKRKATRSTAVIKNTLKDNKTTIA